MINKNTLQEMFMDTLDIYEKQYKKKYNKELDGKAYNKFIIYLFNRALGKRI